MNRFELLRPALGGALVDVKAAITMSFSVGSWVTPALLSALLHPA